MKKISFILIAFTISFLYWTLDAYLLASLHDSLFMDEFFAQTSHTIISLKLVTAFALFILALMPLFLHSKKSHPTKTSLNEIGSLQRMAEILFSSLSTKSNVMKALEMMEELLHLESAILFVYNKETLTIYNENEFIKASFRSKEIVPARLSHSHSAVEEIAIQCYTEKRPFSKDAITLEKRPVTLFSLALHEERSERAMGSLMLVSNNPHFIEEHLPFIQKCIPMVTFVLSLSAKKELLQNLHTQHSANNVSNQHFDIVYNIINHSKLQEHIEHEFNRHKRYHTEVTLVVIDITMLANLSKIFPTETIVTFKKEFIQFVKKNTRDVDIFGKWTNEQFALLLPDVDFRAGQKVAQKLKKMLEETKFARVGKISCSYGITSLTPKDTISSFKTRAESALLSASSNEGDNIEIKLHPNLMMDA